MLNPVKLQGYTDLQRSTWPSDDERQAVWLKSPYSAPRWEILGKNGSVEFFDFKSPAANGTLLTDHESLYRTTKEFAYWIRQNPESKVNDAVSHKHDVSDIITLSVALTYLGIRSYAQIDRTLYSEIMNRWRFGTEGLLEGSSLLRQYFTRFEKIEDIPPDLITGVGAKRQLVRKNILLACGIPWASTPQIRWEMDQFAQRMGGLMLSAAFTESRPPLKQTTAALVGSRRSHFRNLYNLAPYMRSETITFQPQTLGIGKNTREKGRSTVTTRFVPPTLMFKLMAYAAELVAEQFDRIKGVVETHYPKSVASSSSAPLSVSNASTLIKRFSIAVYLLVSVFTARRPEEVNRLRRDCIRGSDRDGWSLNVFIVKNLNEWVWVPIPPIVAKAIQGLLALQPDLSSDERLFKIPDISLGRPVTLRALDHLPRLAQDADAISYKTKNGKDAEWEWIPRQTRRFIAALFYWRYDGPAEVVQHMLRHVNIGDTRPYIEHDAELTTIWDEEAWHFARRLTESIATEADDWSGPMGNRLTRMRQLIMHNLRKNLVVIDPERIADGIQEIMRREMLVLIPKAWVICSCPATLGAADKAMCRKQQGQGNDRRIGPDFTRAGPVPCATCYWGIQNNRTKSFMRKEIQELELAVADPSRRGTIFGAIEEKNLVQLLQIEKKGGAGKVADTTQGIFA